jgi:hypothetical protein
MARGRSGDPGGAGRALTAATALLERGYRGPAARGAGVASQADWLICELLHAEATRQLAGGPDE